VLVGTILACAHYEQEKSYGIVRLIAQIRIKYFCWTIMFENFAIKLQ